MLGLVSLPSPVVQLGPNEILIASITQSRRSLLRQNTPVQQNSHNQILSQQPVTAKQNKSKSGLSLGPRIQNLFSRVQSMFVRRGSRSLSLSSVTNIATQAPTAKNVHMVYEKKEKLNQPFFLRTRQINYTADVEIQAVQLKWANLKTFTQKNHIKKLKRLKRC